MMDIDVISDELYQHVLKALRELQYTFINDDDKLISKPSTSTLSIHANDAIPSSRVYSFVTQLRNTLACSSNADRYISALEIHGPITTWQTCFLNKQQHAHYVWDISIY